MNSNTVNFKRAKETKFLIMDEIVFDKLSPFALKLYGQLRKLISYTQECDVLSISVPKLAKLSNISERKIYSLLNELEHEHYLIQRINTKDYRYGQANTYNVSQTYNYYKPFDATNLPFIKNDHTHLSTTPAPNTVQILNTPAPYAVPVQNLPTPAQYADPPAQYADLYIEQESSQELKETTTAKPKDSSSIFNQLQKQKIINLKLKNDERSDEQFFEEVKYHIENASDKKFNIFQRIAGAMKMLTTLHETNCLFQTPKGIAAIQKEIKKEVTQQTIRINHGYQEYQGRLKADMKLGLVPKNTEILPLDVWMSKNAAYG